MQKCHTKKRNKLQSAVSDVVKTYREKQYKSISLISSEIGMTKSMWADLEKGIKDPQLSTLWRISEALNIPLSSLIVDVERALGHEFSLIE